MTSETEYDIQEPLANNEPRIYYDVAYVTDLSLFLYA